MKKVVVLLVVLSIVLTSCAKWRDMRAAKHQPYKPHKDQKQKHKKHKSR